MKLFISQPMNGRTDEEILAERQRLIEFAEQQLGEKVEVLDSFVQNADYKQKPVKYLANAISVLAEANVAIFANGWEKARGCRIEHEICERYYILHIDEAN